ncbi:dual specificity protein phosphatase 8 [Archocentrus centrarchus]|uniref:dual specificity protein phosphatase 8 n=1 Tax=Archocentrus centrarchus TaxID=63155 RepID=UPI0011EA3DAD|nr:dual specificity protein phosphatase 8-like [Archocentrus centrarchus]
MVWSQEREEVQRPPLSVILPQLYLGAESDVTQDQLASLGISYVLSVSRCSPQPSFLPGSRYLRIPIDDSLRDELLPWIPRALHFIDIAMSSGASVLVHCAAGISRSPALAVAYIMYSLEMDLDHAYRFVKERRPSISPNFNFLGQLQHLQGALSQKSCGHDLLIQQLASCLPSVNDSVNESVSSSCQAERVAADSAHHKDQTQQRHSLSDSSEHKQQKLWTLHYNQQAVQKPPEVPVSGPCKPSKPGPKATQLPLPSGTASLLEKRKSLTLSLTPLGTCPSSTANRSQQETTDQSRKTEERPEAETRSYPGSYRQAGDSHRKQSVSGSKNSRAGVKEQGLLSPFSFTLNKLLGWGEKVLLGGVFVHPVQMGQPALPYRC